MGNKIFEAAFLAVATTVAGLVGAKVYTSLNDKEDLYLEKLGEDISEDEIEPGLF